ncbi:MAG: MBL fold metallo-hydrolase, partial [Candidatus Obscuribacterales bacterium]|nr:MBL fold metallo-hydrolase [Candidatus Obscuribacterales bacterium]
MKITLFGAASEVTGSAYYLESDSGTVLIDCGLFQGSSKLEKLNRIPAGLSCEKLDAVLLTHGHLDHCGRLPLLRRAGYRGPIYASAGSFDIARLILEDAARIQEDDAERENRKRKQNGLKAVKPLFSIKDVEKVLEQFRIVEFEKHLQIVPGIKARFVDAGHILGSSSIELMLSDDGSEKHVVFSGDIGQWNAPIVKDPSIIEKADLCFLESTYGDRDHRSLPDTLIELESLVKAAIERKGKILMPIFAVGRTQQVLYHFAEMFRKKLFEPFPIYLDSPMAIEATRLYANHPELMDEEALALQESGQLRRDLATLRICRSREQSQALNGIQGPCLILAGSGMCTAGRI